MKKLSLRQLSPYCKTDMANNSRDRSLKHSLICVTLTLYNLISYTYNTYTRMRQGTRVVVGGL